MKRHIRFLDSEYYVCLPGERSRSENSNLGMQRVDLALAPTLAGCVNLDRFLDLSEAHIVTSATRGLMALHSTTLQNSLKFSNETV